MSTLGDFFGDSETAVKECLYCGSTDGELVVAVRDANGPTHWEHKECEERHQAAKAPRREHISEWDLRGSETGE